MHALSTVTKVIVAFVALLMLAPLTFASDRTASCGDGGKTESFHSFFLRYTSDRQFAISRTVYPYRDVSESSELKTTRTRITRDKETDQSLQEIAKREGMQLKVTRAGKTRSEGRLFIPDAGFFVDFKFRLKNECWEMYETYTSAY